MGCDIHLHIEVKINNIWHHWAAPNIDRNYDLFAKMANVRNEDNEIEPISKPKGMPDCASFVTEFECARFGIDGHSHSWLSLNEIKLLSKYLEKRYKPSWWSFEHHLLKGTYLCGNPFSTLKDYPQNYPKEIQDVRFVFWFDN